MCMYIDYRFIRPPVGGARGVLDVASALRIFADVLASAEGRGQFEAVVFAIFGRANGATITAFRAALSGLAR